MGILYYALLEVLDSTVLLSLPGLVLRQGLLQVLEPIFLSILCSFLQAAIAG